MNKTQWNTCADSTPMLEFLRASGKASERRLRLFAIAGCRRMSRLMTDERSCKAVEVAEDFVDGRTNHQERQSAANAAWDAANPTHYRDWTGAGYAAAAAAARVVDRDWPLFGRSQPYGEIASEYAWLAAQNSVFFLDKTARCDLLRDIFGPLPLCTATIEPSLLTPEVVSLAQTIYENRRFEDMPLLADALEEAGWVNEEITRHCRSGAEHVRGCWVVDLLLGKS
jgi:hypothetical protein